MFKVHKGYNLRKVFTVVFSERQGDISNENNLDKDRWNKCAELFLTNESDFKNIKQVIFYYIFHESIFDLFCKQNDIKVEESFDEDRYKIRAVFPNVVYKVEFPDKLSCKEIILCHLLDKGYFICLEDNTKVNMFEIEYNNNSTKPKYYLAKKLYTCFQESFFNTKQLEALCKFELESQERKLRYSAAALIFFSLYDLDLKKKKLM